AGAMSNIRVGSMTAGLAYLLPYAICEFQSRHRDVSVHITERAFNPLLELLQARDLDIIVGTVDARAHAVGLGHEVLFEDQIIAITGRHHPLVGQPGVSWSDLIAYPWVMPPRDTLMRT